MKKIKINLKNMSQTTVPDNFFEKYLSPTPQQSLREKIKEKLIGGELKDDIVDSICAVFAEEIKKMIVKNAKYPHDRGYNEAILDFLIILGGGK